MRVYVVGGYVRDFFMNKSSNDYDFVVVGADPEEFKDYQQVGLDFPVFLHPKWGWEVAFARVERKNGTGYKGFDIDWKGVTLEEDLSRRDLTMNAMAIEVDWELTQSKGYPVLDPMASIIDPFNGQMDIMRKQLKPTTEAFKEDPLRLLRAGRFLSRFEDFKPSIELMIACRELESSGELDCLQPDRIWKETEKALKTLHPRKYFEFLNQFDFEYMNIFKEMERTVEGNDWHQEANVFVHTMMVLEEASITWNDPEINFACLMHDIAKPYCYDKYGSGRGHDGQVGLDMIDRYCEQWKVPNTYRDLSKIVCEHHQKIHSVFGRGSNGWVRPQTILKIFQKSNALAKPDRFRKALKVCEADSKGRIGKATESRYLQEAYLDECLHVASSLDTKPIAEKLIARGKKGELIGQAIASERVNLLRGVQKEWKEIL